MRIFLLLLMLVSSPAAAAPLSVDISTHEILISTSFKGERLTLFGGVDPQYNKGEVIVTIEGPKEKLVLHRKVREGGIWWNKNRTIVPSVPSFYWLSTSAPLSRMMDKATERQHRLGDAALNFKDRRGQAIAATLNDAIIANRVHHGLFTLREGDIRIKGDNLFRVDIDFPAIVATGNYTITAYLFSEGALVATSTTPLAVKKTGFSGEIAAFAADHAFFYGAFGVLGALLVGFLVHRLMRRNA